MIRFRCKMPLYQCLILELKESGFVDSSNYLQNLLYDNAQLVAEDDIGIVVDLRKREDYLEAICEKFMAAERERERGRFERFFLINDDIACILACNKIQRNLYKRLS